MLYRAHLTMSRIRTHKALIAQVLYLYGHWGKLFDACHNFIIYLHLQGKLTDTHFLYTNQNLTFE